MRKIPEDIGKFILDAKSKSASDIHICADTPVMYRIGRKLKRASHGALPVEYSQQLCYGLMDELLVAEFERSHDVDFMLGDEHGRYRINISMNNGTVGAVIRLLPERPWSLADLHLPPVVSDLTNRTKGLILITGSTGQGKTTTMSAMIDAVNHREKKHIVTIEDPIEAVHDNDQSVIRQREVGKDTATFPRALRAALRQDPDIIAVGEMRDYETIRIALTAAETGTLVLSTLHVISIDKIIERLISYSPPEEEGHIRNLLADTLQAIVHQELMPTIEGKKRVATEILIATDAVRNIIRRRGTFLLRSIIQTGTRLGMRSMVQSIREMQEEGIILPEVAEGVMVNYAM